MNINRVVGCVAFVLASSVTTTGILAAKKEPAEPPRDPDTGQFAYQGVIQVEGVSAHDLYKRAKTWVATEYKSANAVIQLDDAEEGRLIVKGGFDIVYAAWAGTTAFMSHTLTIETKDGRYRYLLTDFVYLPPNLSMALETVPSSYFGPKIRRNTCAPAEALVKSLEEGMTRASPIGKDNW